MDDNLPTLAQLQPLVIIGDGGLVATKDEDLCPEPRLTLIVLATVLKNLITLIISVIIYILRIKYSIRYIYNFLFHF